MYPRAAMRLLAFVMFAVSKALLAPAGSCARRAARGRLLASVAPPDSAASPAAEQGTATARRQRVLSGVQPTGSLHLGNYLGAIRQWVKNQDEYDSLFCVVDLHAITAPHDSKRLPQETVEAAAIYLAAGIDPTKSRIFVQVRSCGARGHGPVSTRFRAARPHPRHPRAQSHVTAHAELAWLLNCATPINWLERMIQYKEKARKQGENVGVGLFDYPVLMAADILLYQARALVCRAAPMRKSDMPHPRAGGSRASGRGPEATSRAHARHCSPIQRSLCQEEARLQGAAGAHLAGS